MTEGALALLAAELGNLDCGLRATEHTREVLSEYGFSDADIAQVT